MDKKYDIKFMRANVTVWPKCIDGDYMNVNYIFPTKQKDVCDIIKAVLPDENICHRRYAYPYRYKQVEYA